VSAAVDSSWAKFNSTRDNTMMPAIGSLFLALYVLVVIGVSIFLLVLLIRFVAAHQQIAAALERIAQGPSRDNR
jgi:hypothetical protein